jgi:MFS family permease
MEYPPAAPSRSARIRAWASFPFRLGPPGPKDTSTPFGGLAIVHNLSSAGDAMVTVALAGSVFVSVSLGAARSRTALGLLCTVLPFAVVGPFVGPLIDRARGGRRFIVFLAAIGRMAACLLMSSWIHSLLLFPAAFLSLVCSKTHAVAKASLVPGVVDSDQDLVRANAKLAVGSSIFTSLAAALGSLIYRLFGSHALLDTDVLVFAATAALSLHLLSGAREVPVLGDQAGPSAARAASTEALKGLRRLYNRAATSLRGGPRPPVASEVLLAQVAMAGMRAVAGFLTALVVFGFRTERAPVIWYGLVAVASVGGNFSGALLAPPLRDRVSEKRLVASAALLIVATAVGATQMSWLHRRPAALILAAVVGLGAGVAKAAFDAIVQRESPDADRSRLFARFEAIFQLVWVVGALFPTLVAISLLPGFVLIACTMVVTTSVFLVGLARDRRKPMASGRPGTFDEHRAFDGPPPPDTYQPPDYHEPPALPEPPRWPAPAPDS